MSLNTPRLTPSSLASLPRAFTQCVIVRTWIVYHTDTVGFDSGVKTKRFLFARLVSPTSLLPGLFTWLVVAHKCSAPPRSVMGSIHHNEEHNKVDSLCLRTRDLALRISSHSILKLVIIVHDLAFCSMRAMTGRPARRFCLDRSSSSR